MTHFTWNPVTIWLTIGLLAAIVEVLSPLFGFIFITAAAFLAAILAVSGLSVSIQLVVFAATLLLMLVIVRPRVVARIAASKGVPSRTDRLLGERGRLIEPIDPTLGSGRVQVGGSDWAAQSSEPLPAGSEVVVRRADGIVLHVERVG